MIEPNRIVDLGQESSQPGPIEDEQVRLQLTKLFGESLFGPWPELEHNARQPLRRRRSFKWIWRLGVLMGLVAAGWSVRVLVRPGLERQVNDQRAHYAEELLSFVNDGELGQASKYVRLVRADADGNERKEIDPANPHVELMVRTEAVLYRYFDADPERVHRIQAFLADGGQATPQRRIAGLTIVSREERARRLAELESLRRELPNHNEVEYLLATALEFRGETKSAREAWERSAQLGPGWLGHRFEQAWFERRQDSKTTADKIATQIVKMAPDSGWAKSSTVFFGLTGVAKDAERPEAGAPAVSPIEVFYDQLQQGILAARRNANTEAKQRLEAAASAVHTEAPFLLDAFDWLLAEKLPSLARELTLVTGWPTNSEVARSKVERLAKLTDEPPSSDAARTTSPAKTSSATKQSVRTPGKTTQKRKTGRRPGK